MKLDELTQQNHPPEPTFVLDPRRSSGMRWLNEPKDSAVSISLGGMVAAGSNLPSTMPIATVIPEN